MAISSTTTPSGVTATGLPTRRLALATLAGVGAALALPRPVHASASADGDVFAQVRETKRLQQAAEAASDRYGALDEKVCALGGPRPQLDKKALNEACMKVLLAFDTVTTEVDQAVLRLRRGTEAEFQAEVQAWDREREDLEVRTGLKAAKRSEARAVRRMIAAVNGLAAMKATTLPGLIAKASVFEVPPDNDYLDDHHDTLARSVMSDLATIGGAA